ncbi:transketolase [Candidatus Woesearchaeota archaeon CG10_big_fil_rev_8_21_14_0_10_30_7]|nr:MAG: transketolase [Candidatus Woesearchaeota archaeon CG10_big_fil_rev_8_21_14_0_10_30_7]
MNDITKLELKANEIRQDIIKSLVSAGSGHSAGPLGMTDIFTALYFNILKHNSKNPNWKERDRLVLSNGHICPVLYTTMAHAGYFSKTKLKTLRKLGSSLQGHPHRTALKGLETTSGPLGCGLSQAAGMAYGLRMDNKKNRVFVLTSDGEHEEGNTWEGAMFAGKNKLNNLVQIMDRNNIQIDGNTEEIMPLEPLKEKYASFNWHVIEINGHDFNDIFNACNKAMTILNKPIIIIAHTIPGKGVSFMENDYTWHGKPPSVEQAKVALKELEHIKELIKKGGSL